MITSGTEVTYLVGKNAKGPCAMDVRVISASIDKHERLGVIARIFVDDGFGFINDNNGQEWYFHRKQVRAEQWETMSPRTSVRFNPGENEKGPMAIDVRIEH